MDKLSARIRYIKDCLSVYDKIPIKYISAKEVRITGKLAMCRTPKREHTNEEHYLAYVAIHDVNGAMREWDYTNERMVEKKQQKDSI